MPFLTSKSYLQALVMAVWLLQPGSSSIARAQPGPLGPVGQPPKKDTDAEATDEQQDDSGRVTDAEFRLPVDERTAAEVDRFIRLLGSPRYEEREAATEGLLSVGAPAFAKLREAYHKTDDLEVRLRIEEVVDDAYLDFHVFGRTGFLGIRRDPVIPTHEDDDRIPPRHVGIKLGDVLPNTSAERAGLRQNDVIMAVDGEPISGGLFSGFDHFSKQIRERGVGGQITFTVLRGDQTLQVVATLGAAPRERYRNITGFEQLVTETEYKFHIWWDKYFNDPDALETDSGTR